jgi:hypothetical protein
MARLEAHLGQSANFVLCGSRACGSRRRTRENISGLCRAPEKEVTHGDGPLAKRDIRADLCRLQRIQEPIAGMLVAHSMKYSPLMTKRLYTEIRHALAELAVSICR